MFIHTIEKLDANFRLHPKNCVIRMKERINLYSGIEIVHGSETKKNKHDEKATLREFSFSLEIIIMNSIDTMALMNCINSTSTAQRIQFKIFVLGIYPKPPMLKPRVDLSIMSRSFCD